MSDGPSMLEYVDNRFDASETAVRVALKGVDDRFSHLEKLFTLAQDNTKRAVDKAEAAQSAHNTASNEWRGTLNDFKSTLVSRGEFEQLRQDFAAYRLEASRLFAAQAGEKSGTKDTKDDSRAWVGTAIAIVTAIVALVTVFVKH